MATRNVVLSHHQHEALRDAAETGWSDLAAGRFDEVADADLDDLIGKLGAQAARTRRAG